MSNPSSTASPPDSVASSSSSSWHYREGRPELSSIPLRPPPSSDQVQSASPPPLAAPSPAPPARSRTLLTEFILGGIATCGACVFSHPMETIKVRMQLDGERVSNAAAGSNAKLIYRNPFHAFMLITRNEGVRGLYKGVLPAMAYQCCMNGSRLTLFGHVKRELCALIYRTPEPRFNPPFAIQILSGSISGIIAAGAAMPLFLVKIRLQSQAVQNISAVGVQHNYTGMLAAFSTIIRNEGIFGLWTGVSASMLRVGVGSGIQLATYESSKRFLIDNFHLSDSLSSHLGASLLSGWGVTVGMNPPDVISTRMANQKGAMYTSIWDCIIKTTRNEGFGALYKGFWAHYLRSGPHTMFTFIFWEQVKSLATKYGY